jgi:hypothetical protein
MKILVTGATGFIGAAVARKLSQACKQPLSSDFRKGTNFFTKFGDKTCQSVRFSPAKNLIPRPSRRHTFADSSDWNTKRSPTTRISGWLPRISCSLPKNSER